MVDWSYVAGLFDHKGNINIVNVSGKEYFQLRLYSGHKQTLSEIQKFLECGNIYQKKLSKKNKNWNDSFELTITTKEDIFIVLTQILPYLVKRKNEVEKILKTHKLFKDFRDVTKEVARGYKGKETADGSSNIVETNVQTQKSEGQSREQEEKNPELAQREKEDISYIG